MIIVLFLLVVLFVAYLLYIYSKRLDFLMQCILATGLFVFALIVQYFAIFTLEYGRPYWIIKDVLGFQYLLNDKPLFSLGLDWLYARGNNASTLSLALFHIILTALLYLTLSNKDRVRKLKIVSIYVCAYCVDLVIRFTISEYAHDFFVISIPKLVSLTIDVKDMIYISLTIYAMPYVVQTSFQELHEKWKAHKGNLA